MTSRYKFLLLSLLITLSDQYVSNGKVDQLTSWAFLDRFCFTPIDCDVIDCNDKDAVSNYGMFEYVSLLEKDVMMMTCQASEVGD